MRFTLTRFGGIAGIPRPLAAVDTRQLAAALQARLQGLLDESNFWSLPAELPSQGEAPDAFSYELSVEDDAGRAHAVAFDHASQTPELAGLVAAVQSAAGA